MIWLLFLFVLFVAFLFWRSKISIDILSFFQPSLPLSRGKFGVYCFTGKQGSGKTYSLVRFIMKHVKADQVIYSNITLVGIDYEPIRSVEHLLSLADKHNVFIVFDEIFTLIEKDRRLGADLMEFLTQQRKMGNIFMTTAQEWLDLSVTFRRYIKVQVDCLTYPLGRFGGLLREDYYDAYQMRWSSFDNEYVAPLISSKWSKYERRIMRSYDTFERIRRFSDRM